MSENSFVELPTLDQGVAFTVESPVYQGPWSETITSAPELVPGFEAVTVTIDAPAFETFTLVMP